MDKHTHACKLTQTGRQADKIVGTPSIITKEVKDKIKSQARKSPVSTSQSILPITVFASLTNGSFPQNTHIHTQNIGDQ